jgi:hypothetical protein
MGDWWKRGAGVARDPAGVINVRVAELRNPGRCGGKARAYHDLAAWLAASTDHVYCGRRVHHVSASFDSIFSNDTPRGSGLEVFEQRFREKLEGDPELVVQTAALVDKTLGCWCKPKDCHCDILWKLAEECAGMVASGVVDKSDAWEYDEDYEDMGDDFAVGGTAAPRGNRGAAGSGGGRRRVDGKETRYSSKHVRRRVGSSS